MCGLYGAVSNNMLDVHLIKELAALAGRRGPDAHGYYNGYDRHVARGLVKPHEILTGNYYPKKPEVGNIHIEHVHNRWHHMHIGHARLATVHDVGTEDDIQPLIWNDILIAHNGSIYDYQRWKEEAQTAGHTLKTSNDSEVLAYLISQSIIRNLRDRVDQVLEMVDTQNHHALVVADLKTREIVLSAKNQHLYYKLYSDTLYWCSIPHTPHWEQVENVYWRYKHGTTVEESNHRA